MATLKIRSRDFSRMSSRITDVNSKDDKNCLKRRIAFDLLVHSAHSALLG